MTTLTSILVAAAACGVMIMLIHFLLRLAFLARNPPALAPESYWWGQRLPPLAILLSITVIAASGVFDTDVRPILWLHHFGIILLAVFLLVAQYHLIAMWLSAYRGDPIQTYLAPSRRLRDVTELLPAPAAISILLSGLALVYKTPYGLAQGWLLGLTLIFAVMFVDGLSGYLPYVRRLDDLVQKAVAQPGFAPLVTAHLTGQSAVVKLLFHFFSFPLAFGLGYSKPPLTACENLTAIFAGFTAPGSRVGSIVLCIAFVGAFIAAWNMRALSRRG